MTQLFLSGELIHVKDATPNKQMGAISTEEAMLDIVHRLSCVPECQEHCHPHHSLPYDPAIGYFPWGMCDGMAYPRLRPSPLTGSSEITLLDMCRMARVVRSDKHIGMDSFGTADCAGDCATCPGGKYKDTFEPCRRAHGLKSLVLRLPKGQVPDTYWHAIYKDSYLPIHLYPSGHYPEHTCWQCLAGRPYVQTAPGSDFRLLDFWIMFKHEYWFKDNGLAVTSSDDLVFDDLVTSPDDMVNFCVLAPPPCPGSPVSQG